MRKNKNLEPRFDSIKSGNALEHFQAKRIPVRVKKMRKNKNLEQIPQKWTPVLRKEQASLPVRAFPSLASFDPQ
jgi:sulfatase maturation enzyme AslB (radical SAM superfamily)